MSTIPEQYQGAGYGTIYSDSELRQAIAVIDCLILNGLAGSGSVIEPDIAPIERTPAIMRVSDQGVIPSGTKTCLISNIGATSGILLGVEFLPQDSISLEVTDNDVIGAISYDATGTIFLIITLV